MRTRWIVLLTVLLVAANANAGSLQDRLAELIGIDSEAEVAAPMGLAAGAESGNIVLWGLGQPTRVDNSGSEFSGRLGWETDDIEVGIQVDRIDHRESIGMYFIMLLEGDISSALGRAYTGFVVNDAGNGPIAGTVVNDFLAVEYRYLDAAQDRHTLYAGLRYPF
jgi:hypothetical protein